MRQLYICLIIIFVFLPFLNAQETLEKKVAEQEKLLLSVSGIEKVIVLNRLASYFYRNQPEKTINYGSQALELAEKINDPNGKAKAFILLANAYQVQGDVKKSFQYGQEALLIMEKLGDKTGMINALNTLGYILMDIGDYVESLDYLVRALEICDKIGDLPRKSGIYYQLGNLYLRLEDYHKAMEYYQNVFAFAESKGNLERMAFALNNIGMVYRAREQYQKALESFQKSLEIFTQLKNSYGITAATGNIGKTYGYLNNYPKALEYLQIAAKTAEGNNDLKASYAIFLDCGNQYFQLKEYKKAAFNYEKALQMAKDNSDKDTLEMIYKSMSDLYLAQKDYKQAMEYYTKSTGIKDQLVNERKNRQMLILQERYEAEKKAREIESLKKNNEIQRLTRNAFIAGFALVLVILVFIFKKYLYLFSFWKKQKYIGQYRLITVVGSGGMSTVFKAHGIKDKNEIVAIKVLKDELARRESTRKRFKLEGIIIDKLDHPNIIKIFERGEYHEKLFIVMEFLEGKTLTEKIETGGMLLLPDSLHIMRQIAAGLAFIHRANIVHRDMKPGNIMIIEKEKEKPLVKLLDFGLSRMQFQSRITMTGVLVGTASYMAPEQISQLLSSPASDVFNLGLIFYEILTGKVAFPGDSLSEIERKILYTMPAVPINLRPEIPGELNDLIMQMLSKDPAQRPTAETVYTRLSHCATGIY